MLTAYSAGNQDVLSQIFYTVLPNPYILVIYVLLIFTTILIIWTGVPFMFTQWKCGMFKTDALLTASDNKVVLEAGKKENLSNIMYKRSGGVLGKRIRHIDPSKFGLRTGYRFGPINTLRWYAVGKFMPKPYMGMLAAEQCLAVAKTQVDEADVTAYEAGLKDYFAGKGLVAKLFKPKGTFKAEIIRHNNYLHLIAEKNPKHALLLLRCDDDEIPFYANMHMVLPEGIKPEDTIAADGGTTTAVEKVLVDLVDEV